MIAVRQGGGTSCSGLPGHADRSSGGAFIADDNAVRTVIKRVKRKVICKQFLILLKRRDCSYNDQSRQIYFFSAFRSLFQGPVRYSSRICAGSGGFRTPVFGLKECAAIIPDSAHSPHTSPQCPGRPLPESACPDTWQPSDHRRRNLPRWWQGIHCRSRRWSLRC